LDFLSSSVFCFCNSYVRAPSYLGSWASAKLNTTVTRGIAINDLHNALAKARPAAHRFVSICSSRAAVCAGVG
jgi:hypothetical protein